MCSWKGMSVEGSKDELIGATLCSWAWFGPLCSQLSKLTNVQHISLLSLNISNLMYTLISTVIPVKWLNLMQLRIMVYWKKQK